VDVRRHERRHSARALAVLCAALTLAGCGGRDEPDPKLAALEREAVASFVPPGGRLDFDGRGEEGTPAGKPTPARVLRTFVYSNRAQAEKGRRALVALANSSGWQLDLARDPIRGIKRLSTGEAILVIGDHDAGNVVEITVVLEHR
jgi:hypothetical protein